VNQLVLLSAFIVTLHLAWTELLTFYIAMCL